MRKALSIDKLYQKVEDYDTVVTTDPSLAEALNSRLEKPVEGVFSDTPKRLAAKEDFDTKREVFLKLANETDLSWRQASYSLDRTLEAWKYTGRLEGILDFEDGEIFRKTVNFLEETETSFHSIQDFELEGDIAVVNLYQFNELDKTILPEEFDTFEMLEQEKEEFSQFNIYSSGLELIKSLVNNVERAGVENSAIVVNPDSKYQRLLESYLNTEDLEFTYKEGISEDKNLRTFLTILEIGVSDRSLRIRDIKPIAQQLKLPLGNENSFLDNIDGLEDFKEFINVIEFLEIGDALDKFEDISGEEYEEIRLLLEDINLASRNVNNENVDKMKYFLRNYDLTLEESSDGIILADPKNTTVVDRSVVFYVGMGSDWNEKAPEEPWIKRREYEDKKLKNFQILIQNGDSQIYMVEDREMEEEIKPSFHFDEIIGENIDSFTQLPHNLKKAEDSVKASSFKKKDIKGSEIKYLSQSGLNDLVRSPRLFYMSKLISEADEGPMRKGRLFHDFAELYFNHPDIEERIEEIKKIFLEEMNEISDEISIEKLKTEIDHGLSNLMSFIDGEGYRGEGYIRSEGEENILAKSLKLDIQTSSTEMYFKNKDKQIKGKVDLIKDAHHLVDFKSGSKKSKKELVKRSRVETFEESRYPDFQALMYLSHHSEQVEGPVKFSYVYFLDDLGDSLGGNHSEIESTITLYPEEFKDKVSTTEAFEYLIKDVKKSNDRRKTLEKLGYTEYKSFLEDRKIPRLFNKNEFLETEFANEFVSLCLEKVGDYKYARKGAKSALKKIIEYRNTRLFQDDIEVFKSFVDEKISEIQEFEDSAYPVKKDVSELPMEDLIIE